MAETKQTLWEGIWTSWRYEALLRLNEKPSNEGAESTNLRPNGWSQGRS